jgi:hypothetical protein
MQAQIMIGLQADLEGETGMQATLNDRVDALERQVRTLTEIVKGKEAAHDWRSTFGASAHDEGFEEMVRLGEEIRQRDREKAEADADPGH